MAANLIGAAIVIAVAVALLFLREFILRIGRPTKPPGSRVVELRQKYRVDLARVRGSRVAARRREQDSVTDASPSSSPIRVEEFLAELRATAADPSKEGDAKSTRRFTSRRF
jgi:hypothetical protein